MNNILKKREQVRNDIIQVTKQIVLLMKSFISFVHIRRIF